MSNGSITIQVSTKDQSRRHGGRSQHDRKTYAEHHERVPGTFQCAGQHGDTAVEPEQFNKFQRDKETNQSHDVGEHQIPVSGNLEIDILVRGAIILGQFSQQYIDQMVTIEIEKDRQYGENDVGKFHKIPKLFEVSMVVVKKRKAVK